MPIADGATATRFAVNLRRARQTEDLARRSWDFRCELHRTEISLDSERGRREPACGTIVKLASASGTTPGGPLRGHPLDRKVAELLLGEERAATR